VNITLSNIKNAPQSQVKCHEEEHN